MPFKPGRHVSEWLARSLSSWLSVDTSDEEVNSHLLALTVDEMTNGLTQEQRTRVVLPPPLISSPLISSPRCLILRREATSLVKDCRALGRPSRFLEKPVDTRPDTAPLTIDAPRCLLVSRMCSGCTTTSCPPHVHSA